MKIAIVGPADAEKLAQIRTRYPEITFQPISFQSLRDINGFDGVVISHGFSCANCSALSLYAAIQAAKGTHYPVTLIGPGTDLLDTDDIQLADALHTVITMLGWFKKLPVTPARLTPNLFQLLVEGTFQVTPVARQLAT